MAMAPAPIRNLGADGFGGEMVCMPPVVWAACAFAASESSGLDSASVNLGSLERTTGAARLLTAPDLATGKPGELAALAPMLTSAQVSALFAVLDPPARPSPQQAKAIFDAVVRSAAAAAGAGGGGGPGDGTFVDAMTIAPIALPVGTAPEEVALFARALPRSVRLRNLDSR